MSDERPDVFIIAGEASGDLIGSLLVKRLKKLRPDLRIAGVGGSQMEEAGADIRYNIVRDLSIIGFLEVISKFGKIRRLFHDTLDYLRLHRPRVVIFIDYPGFNLRMAKQAHLLGLKVVYYVVPQVWAWHKSRIHKIRKYVDKALVIFPFEEKMLREAGVNVEYVGHPLLDVMILTMCKEEVFERFKLDPGRRLIGLLPGSRKREIDTLLPIMVGAAEKIRDQLPNVQFVLPRAPTIRREQIDRHLAGTDIDVHVVDTFRYNVRSTMDFALVASGTATLETGLLLCPMVILYKVSYLTWLIGRMVVNVPYLGLINIVAENMVVPELLQDQCTPGNAASRTLSILANPDEVARIKADLARVKEKMGGPGASRRVAQIILDVIDQPSVNSTV